MARLVPTVPALGIALLLALPAKATIEQVVRERLLESDSPVCVAAGVVDAQTSTVFACSAGAGRPSFDEHSIFEVGSVTKGITGLILADMVVRGELSIDDAASKHSRPGAKLPRRGAREITLRDLVTHTAGLPRTPPGHAPRDPGDPYGHFDEDALYAALAQTGLDHEPGTRYAYSNLGFMWLSDLLARRAGKSYEALLIERIAEPLGMASTRIQPSAAQHARLVKGHDGAYRVVAPWTIGGNLAGVGLIRSSLADMLRLAQALAGRRSSALDAAIELALRPPSPRAAPDVGYGWNIRRGGASILHDHGGGTGGFVGHVAFDRRNQRASVVLADAAVSIFDLSLHLVDPGYHLRRRLVEAPLPAGGTMRDYLGAYGAGGFVLTVVEDSGRLVAQATGLPTVELFHRGRDGFFARAYDIQLVFSRGAGGKVEFANLYVDGRQSHLQRVAP